MQTFQERKDLVLSRARNAEACSGEYRKAYAATTDAELLTVIAGNFLWCTQKNVIDIDLLKSFPEGQLTTSGIYISGYHVHSDGSYWAYGNATVRAYENATVRAYENATVRAYENATVRAYGNATVRAYGNATVEAYGNATVEAYENATVEAYENATVEAYENANLYVYNGKDVVLLGFSIARFAPYWGAAPTRIQVAKSASELIQVKLSKTPVP